ncbi:hypothetical protein FOZ61_005602 [Perkinsus olseni]|uniref:Uncharacterized protein n=1 Tax=Perkinsus olseni TaxID=32597 RepID=A0A7J6LH45_PEROL|nr:hypothetical protein FOZ61_005602 [Perkinsus olseni]
MVFDDVKKELAAFDDNLNSRATLTVKVELGKQILNRILAEVDNTASDAADVIIIKAQWATILDNQRTATDIERVANHFGYPIPELVDRLIFLYDYDLDEAFGRSPPDQGLQLVRVGSAHSCDSNVVHCCDDCQVGSANGSAPSVVVASSSSSNGLQETVAGNESYWFKRLDALLHRAGWPSGEECYSFLPGIPEIPGKKECSIFPGRLVEILPGYLRASFQWFDLRKHRVRADMRTEGARKKLGSLFQWGRMHSFFPAIFPGIPGNSREWEEWSILPTFGPPWRRKTARAVTTVASALTALAETSSRMGSLVIMLEGRGRSSGSIEDGDGGSQVLSSEGEDSDGPDPLLPAYLTMICDGPTRKNQNIYPAFAYDGDVPIRFEVESPSGFFPVDMAGLSDGSLTILFRGPSGRSGERTMRIALASSTDLSSVMRRSGGTVTPQIILEAAECDGQILKALFLTMSNGHSGWTNACNFSTQSERPCSETHSI